jgi:hypothetical protein
MGISWYFLARILATHDALHPEPDTRRCNSSTVVIDPVKLTRYEQIMIYGTYEIFGLLPMGYLAMSSGLGLMMGDLGDHGYRLQRSASKICRWRCAVRSSVPVIQSW